MHIQLLRFYLSVFYIGEELISVPELIVNKSEENLRHKYDVQIKTIPNDASAVYAGGL